MQSWYKSTYWMITGSVSAKMQHYWTQWIDKIQKNYAYLLLLSAEGSAP